MGKIEGLFEHKYDNANKILIGKILKDKLEKDEAKEILEFVINDIPNFPDHEHYILDVLDVKEVSNPIIGVLMKSLNVLKKTRNYVILVMTEKLLQDIMIHQPAMFDYFAVFHSIDEAIAFTKK